MSEVATSNGLIGDAFTKNTNLIFDLIIGINSTQNVAQYPLHHVTYTSAKLKVVLSKSLGGKDLTIALGGQGHTKGSPVPCTSCD